MTVNVCRWRLLWRKPWEEADLLNRTKSLIVQLRQERRSFALEHFRVSDSLVNTPGAPSSLIDLPSKASFLSLALMTSVVFHEIMYVHLLQFSYLPD